jgi:hypothetical protein
MEESSPDRKHFSRLFAFFDRHLFLTLGLFAAVLGFLCVLFYGTSVSYLYPAFSYDPVDVDGNFFMFTGTQVLAGKIPYLDFFDHKGVLVFYFNALGMAMGGRNGVIFLNFLFVSLGYFFLLLTVHYLGYRGKAFLFSGVLLLAISFVMIGGNCNGNITFPFACFPFLFFARGLRTHNLRFYRWACFFCGLEVGLAFNIRPSDGLVGFLPLVFILIVAIQGRYGTKIIPMIFLSLLGFLIPYAIILPIAVAQGFLQEMILAVFFENGKYIFGHSEFIYYLSFAAVLAWIILGTFLTIRIRRMGEKDLSTLYFCCLYGVGLPNLLWAKYPQYWISAIPFIFLIVFSFAETYFQSAAKPKFHFGKAIAIFSAFFSILCGPGVATFYYGLSYDFSNAQQSAIKDEILGMIPASAYAEEDKVFGLDVNAAYYSWVPYNSSCRYQCYQSWWVGDNKEVEPFILNYLEEKKPTYVLTGAGHTYDSLSYYVYLSANYDETTPSRTDNLQTSGTDSIRLFTLRS